MEQKKDVRSEGGRDRGRSRSAERGRDRDRDRDGDRGRLPRERYERYDDRRYSSRDYRRRSRSRSRSRGKDYSRPRRSPSRSRSPVARPVRYELKKPAAPQANSNRFWDGFQWVDKVNPTTGLSDTGTGTTEPIPGVSGLPKDRRVYVGNLPDNTDTEHLKNFINETLMRCGAVPVGVKTAVLSIWTSGDNKYSFLEMCSADVATVAMGLNGISYLGSSLKIARPKTYAMPISGMPSF